MREYEMANNRRKTENVKRSKRKWGGWIMILICCAVAAAAAIKFNEMMLEQWGVPAPAIPSSAKIERETGKKNGI